MFKKHEGLCFSSLIGPILLIRRENCLITRKAKPSSRLPQCFNHLSCTGLG